MIIIDLEWNRGYDDKPLKEILQIGAVRLERLGGPIIDFFDRYIRPQVHKKFDPGAKELPELYEYIKSDVSFSEAMAAFQDWRGAETGFAAWGSDDFHVLEENCAYWELSAPNFEKTYNLQVAFAHMLDADGRRIALFRAAAYCGIPDTFSFHNALYDAVYTAVVTARITEEALTYEPPPAIRQRKAPKLCKLPFKKQPKLRIDVFPSPEQVLNNKRARRPACPICGQKIWVAQWRKATEQQYYALFCCPEHGRFICRLTLVQREDEQWRGMMTVPAVTPELLEIYHKSLQGEIFSMQNQQPTEKEAQVCPLHAEKVIFELEVIVMRRNFGAKPYLYPQPVLIIATYGEDGTPDAMNAAWGSISDMDQIAMYLSASHKTVKNILARKAFTVSMADADHVEACDYVGIVSGNDVPDKLTRAGFHTTKSELVDAPLIDELPMALECRLVSFDEEAELLVGEIVNVCADERILGENGKIDPVKLRPITFDPVNNEYLVLGEKVGNAFQDGKKLK